MGCTFRTAKSVVLALVTIMSAPSVISQTIQALDSFARISKLQLESIESKLETQKQLSLQSAAKVQLTLDNIRTNASNPQLAKAAAIAAKEDELVKVQRNLTVIETAKQLVLGSMPSLPPSSLSDVLPDAIESIMIMANPMLPTCGNTMSYRGDASHIGWQAMLDQFMATHGELLRGIGRIEIETEKYVQGQGKPVKVKVRNTVGSGFAVGSRRIATAGHVAAIFWDQKAQKLKDGVSAVIFNTGGEYEYGCPNANIGSSSIRLGSVVLVRYTPDIPIKDSPLDYAVVELASDEPSLPIALQISNAIKPAPSTFVVVVEYPDHDPRVDQILWKAAMSVPIEDGMFPIINIKRIAPGMVLPPCNNASNSHVPHNATTLNRSSGAPIIDAETGHVIAIQVSGYRNTPLGQTYCNLGLRSNAPEVSLVFP